LNDRWSCLLDQVLLQVQERDLCPGCAGIDLIYFIAREMTAYGS